MLTPTVVSPTTAAGTLPRINATTVMVIAMTRASTAMSARRRCRCRLLASKRWTNVGSSVRSQDSISAGLRCSASLSIALILHGR